MKFENPLKSFYYDENIYYTLILKDSLYNQYKPFLDLISNITLDRSNVEKSIIIEQIEQYDEYYIISNYQVKEFINTIKLELFRLELE